MLCSSPESVATTSPFEGDGAEQKPRVRYLSEASWKRSALQSAFSQHNMFQVELIVDNLQRSCALRNESTRSLISFGSFWNSPKFVAVDSSEVIKERMLRIWFFKL